MASIDIDNESTAELNDSDQSWLEQVNDHTVQEEAQLEPYCPAAVSYHDQHTANLNRNKRVASQLLSKRMLMHFKLLSQSLDL